jgi:hypothetical protein
MSPRAIPHLLYPPSRAPQGRCKQFPSLETRTKKLGVRGETGRSTCQTLRQTQRRERGGGPGFSFQMLGGTGWMIHFHATLFYDKFVGAP